MSPKRMNWSKNKKENLALAWVGVSEDPEIPPKFWVKVGNVFHDLMGCQSYNLNEICSKFRDMRVKCLEFNGIYNFVINNVDEADPFLMAMHQYEYTKHTPFKHVKA